MLTRQLAPDRVSSSLLLADITNSHNLKLSALKYCKLYKEYIYKVSTWTFSVLSKLSSFQYSVLWS